MHNIATYFEKAFEGEIIPAALAGAIKAMKFKPELCARIPAFRDTLWSIIEDYLNGGGRPKDNDCFICAVALLENLENKARAG